MPSTATQRIPPEIEDFALVLIGEFNPAIFTPRWFAGVGLIDDKDAEHAEIELIHNEVSIFRTNWFRMEVQRERFRIGNIDDISIRIFDLVIRTFKDFLPHTPIRASGLNYSVHYAVENYSNIMRLGERLAPKEPWGEWGSVLLGNEDAEPHKLNEFLGHQLGGLRSLTMEQSLRGDGNPGYIRTKVEPSARVKPGVLVEVNDHYQVEDFDTVIGCSEIIGMIEGQYDSSIQRSKWIIDQVMAL